MRKLRLSEWASIAEIAGTIAVVISLLFVAYSLERNTIAVSGQGVNEMYDANREIQLILLAHPELESIIDAGRKDAANLSGQERLQYLRYLTLCLDIWEKAITRENDGLINEKVIAGWHQWYHDFFRRHLTKDMWGEIKWNWTDPELIQRVEAALER